ncbi:hypothetical protein, partial [Stenotrophomonas pavanii]|uniref:hypothetical protein n=1 Tax=Stenotrophomonas pavanii TaxID=487698 RepID=UPI0039C5DAF1
PRRWTCSSAGSEPEPGRAGRWPAATFPGLPASGRHYQYPDICHHRLRLFNWIAATVDLFQRWF